MSMYHALAASMKHILENEQCFALCHLGDSLLIDMLLINVFVHTHTQRERENGELLILSVNVKKTFGGERTFPCVWRTCTTYGGIAIVSTLKDNNPCIPSFHFSIEDAMP